MRLRGETWHVPSAAVCPLDTGFFLLPRERTQKQIVGGFLKLTLWVLRGTRVADTASTRHGHLLLQPHKHHPLLATPFWEKPLTRAWRGV